MPTTYTGEGVIQLNGVTYTGGEGAPGSTLSWTGVGTPFDGPITIIDEGDDGALDAGVDTADSGGPVFFSGYTITVGGTDFPVYDDGTFAFVVTDAVTNDTFSPSGVSNTFDASAPVADVYVCFAAGTQIATPEGDQSVETLAIGDLVITADGRRTAVKWLGKQTVHKLFTPAERFVPVRVSAGALGDGLPHTDLVLTAGHALIIDDFAIDAGALVNGTTITYDPIESLPDRVTYYHIETDVHDVVMANGAPAETFVDHSERRVFDNFAEYVALYGDERAIYEMDLARISAARLVPPHIKARLATALSA